MIILTGISGGIGLHLSKEISKIDKVIGIYKNSKPKVKLKNVKYIRCDISKEKELFND